MIIYKMLPAQAVPLTGNSIQWYRRKIKGVWEFHKKDDKKRYDYQKMIPQNIQKMIRIHKADACLK